MVVHDGAQLHSGTWLHDDTWLHAGSCQRRCHALGNDEIKSGCMGRQAGATNSCQQLSALPLPPPRRHARGLACPGRAARACPNGRARHASAVAGRRAPGAQLAVSGVGAQPCQRCCTAVGGRGRGCAAGRARCSAGGRRCVAPGTTGHHQRSQRQCAVPVLRAAAGGRFARSNASFCRFLFP